MLLWYISKVQKVAFFFIWFHDGRIPYPFAFQDEKKKKKKTSVSVSINDLHIYLHFYMFFTKIIHTTVYVYFISLLFF